MEGAGGDPHNRHYGDIVSDIYPTPTQLQEMKIQSKLLTGQSFLRRVLSFQDLSFYLI